MFSGFDRDTLHAVLVANDMQLEAAIDHLLAMSVSEATVPATASATVPDGLRSPPSAVSPGSAPYSAPPVLSVPGVVPATDGDFDAAARSAQEERDRALALRIYQEELAALEAEPEPAQGYRLGQHHRARRERRRSKVEGLSSAAKARVDAIYQSIQRKRAQAAQDKAQRTSHADVGLLSDDALGPLSPDDAFAADDVVPSAPGGGAFADLDEEIADMTVGDQSFHLEPPSSGATRRRRRKADREMIDYSQLS
eukprot:gnl/Ergobibamus_cyprinoides/3.p1 GENE.gnl/Ergobibamus_cyprinoides/3~~gnl/Ergobibamus_cyprinoides/3.p1  ORF type:complete len:282 (+),score=45.30 gnl/Ergobibamus_cyprinoides/3:89-847(+)